MSAAGARRRRLAQWRALAAEIGRLDRSKLSRDNQVDAAMLYNHPAPAKSGTRSGCKAGPGIRSSIRAWRATRSIR